MLIVIAYPIYYTIELSFFNTPAKPAAARQDFRRLRQLRRSILTSDVFWRSREHVHLDDRDRPSSPSSWAWGLRSRCIAIFRPGRVARHSDHSLGHQRGRRVLYLEVDLPFGFRHHRRGFGGPRIGRPSAEFHRQRQHRSAVADRRQRLARVPVRHDHADGWDCRPFPISCSGREVDGASAWQRFWHVTFPICRASRP
jgi:hypothetical protein